MSGTRRPPRPPRLYGDADPVTFPEVHRFQVPEGCHWRDVRETPANVGAALQHAMQEIERANPDTLYRVFGAADWGNKEKFTDELLKDLIEGFSVDLARQQRRRAPTSSATPTSTSSASSPTSPAATRPASSTPRAAWCG